MRLNAACTRLWINWKSAVSDDGRSSTLNGFLVLEAVAASDKPLSIRQIEDLTGLPRSTLYRVVRTLVHARALMLEPGGKSYSAGDRLIALAREVNTHSVLHNERHTILKLLVDEIGETCNFTTLDATDVVYVDRVEAKWPLRLHLESGSRVPLHCTSSGKLFMSYMPADQRRTLLKRLPLTPYTEKTITDAARLAKELTAIRSAGIATDDEGYLLGLISVAVPVFGRNRKIIGAVAVHAPRARLELDKALEYASLLRRAASDIGSIYRRFK